MFRFLIFKILFLTLCPSLQAQEFGNFLRQLRTLTTPGAKYLKIDSLIQAQEGLPYIVGDSCHFLFRGVASDVAVSGDFNQWASAEVIMMREPQTDFWHASLEFESDARLGYKFVLDWSNWIIDPLNPDIIEEEYGINSELAMPAYIQPWEINENSNVASGMIEIRSIFSEESMSEYDLHIYLPASYDPGRPEGYPVAYFQDGLRYLELGNAGNVMDNLIDSNLIRDIIAVFIIPNDRLEEFAFSKHEQYKQFVIEELVPFIDDNYHTIPQADYRAVIGNSFGGNISALTAFENPDIFRNCGLHSPDLSPNNFEAFLLFQNNPAKELKVAVNWGTYDELASSLPLYINVLHDKGYEFMAESRPEGHSWGLWRATIDDFLIYFFPPDIINSISPHPGKSMIKVTPNPAKYHINVESVQEFQRFVITDIYGRRIIESKTGHDRDIDIKDLQPGYYILTTISPSGSDSAAFIKI